MALGWVSSLPWGYLLCSILPFGDILVGTVTREQLINRGNRSRVH